MHKPPRKRVPNTSPEKPPDAERQPVDRELRALFQSLIENSFDVIEVVDPEGTTLYISPSSEHVLGYEPKELIGSSVLDFVHHDDLETARRTLKAAAKSEELKPPVEVRAFRKDGELRTFEVVARRLPRQPFIDGVVVNYRDITERKQAEEAHRRSEERFYKAFHSCPSSITISHLKDGRFIEANEGFEKLSGYDRNQIVGKSSYELNLWKNPDQRDDIIQSLKTEGRVREYEGEFRVKTGEIRICHLSADVIELDGELCMLAVTHDITDQKRAEAALRTTADELRRERKELTEKNIALKQVLDHIEAEKASYRHEISAQVENLLRPIISRLKSKGGLLDPRDVDHLEDGLARIIEEDIDEFENNLSKLTPRELDVCELIKKGLSSKEIADRLGLSPQTVHKHRRTIRRKLQITNKDINLAAYLRSR